MFESILNSTAGTLSITSTLICIGVSLVLGVMIAIVHMMSGRYNKNFLITIAVLPAIVQIIIMMVNGNLGTSVAVLGAFSLIRFRSVAGTSREITSVFLAMAIGLATAMGYITFAIATALIICVALIVFSKLPIGEHKKDRKLKVVIPENLDFSNIFDEIFDKYLVKYSLEKVKTTNMGSMFELTYNVLLKDETNQKELIDELRCKNGNLNIILERIEIGENEL